MLSNKVLIEEAEKDVEKTTIFIPIPNFQSENLPPDFTDGRAVDYNDRQDTTTLIDGSGGTGKTTLVKNLQFLCSLHEGVYNLEIFDTWHYRYPGNYYARSVIISEPGDIYRLNNNILEQLDDNGRWR